MPQVSKNPHSIHPRYFQSSVFYFLAPLPPQAAIRKAVNLTLAAETWYGGGLRGTEFHVPGDDEEITDLTF